MLKGFSCRNFRCFREETTFPIAPLTVLVGPNNAGKSTVIDLIRLLARGSVPEETDNSHRFRSGDELFKLDFRSGDHRLSSFDQLLTTGQETFEIETQFDLPFDSDPAVPIEITNGLSVRRKYREYGEAARLQEMDGFLLSPTSKGKSMEEGKPARKRLFHIEYEYRDDIATPGHPPFKESLTYPKHWVAEYDFESGEMRFEHVEKEETSYTTEGLGTYRRTDVSYDATLDPPLIEIALDYINVLRVRQGKPQFDLIPQAACRENDDPYGFPEFFGSDFIGTLESPEGWPADHEDELWEDLREKVLSPLAASINEASRFSVTYAPSSRASGQVYYGASDPLTGLLQSFDRGGSHLRNQVNEWIEKLDLGQDLQVDRKGPSLYEATIERNGERRSLVDCGSGVSQLLPLILQFTQAGRGDVLLAEEPEANLHPDLQARLADLFGELAGSAQGRTAIVETHSEYFVRRIQYLVARGDIEPDLVQILYVEPPDEQSSSQVRPISIDEQGQLSEPFGPGFFDQATDLMVDLFKYGSEN